MKRGFSLVELSIVLVILGLLVGGVLSGQALIRAAELRSVTSEYQRYITSANTFRDKYFAFPGDITNAASFWTSCITDPAALPGPTPTCNGNGDGKINNWESFRYWQHLSLAGLLEGAYNGFVAGDGSTTDFIAPGINAPHSKLNNGIWAANDASVISTPARKGYALAIGAIDTDDIGDVWGTEALMKPEEAWNIDTKMDDGNPMAGSILGFMGVDIGHCLTGSAPNYIYDLGYSSIGCRLVFFAS